MAGARTIGRAGGSGQATVELALCLPVVAVLLLALVQVGLVVRAQALVVQAAREAARAAAVDPSPGAASAAASRAGGLDPSRLEVTVDERGGPGGTTTVTVRYRLRTDVPLVGPAVHDVVLEASATMRVEVAAPGPPRRGAAPSRGELVGTTARAPPAPGGRCTTR